MAAVDVAATIQAAGALGGTGLVAAWLAWKESRKDRSTESATAGGVVAASVISDKSIARLTEVVQAAAESHHDDCRRKRESDEAVIDAVRSLERTIRDGLPPVASLNVAGLMARLDKLEGKG
ncbi:hypothetical protein [Sphingomonas sp.]|uniref:hypothetical protein n=1 Tax=Sphingomonas sp. TaxID=28214 RepID=UPI003B00CD37